MALHTTHPFTPVASSSSHLASPWVASPLAPNSLSFTRGLHRNLGNLSVGSVFQLAIARLQHLKHNSPHFCSSQLRTEGGENSRDSTANGVHSTFGVYLHLLMDQAGINTSHARTARQSFVKEVSKLSSDEKAVSISDCCCLDLARAALEVSAEDDALVSHSPVALPVDSYIERLNGMAMEFAGHHMPTHCSTPETVLHCLDNYLYGYKSFQRLPLSQCGDARGSYLNMVLTRRLGTSAMLALIYSELVKILNIWGVIDFIVDMELPGDHSSLPRPVIVSNSSAKVSSDALATTLLTPHDLLIEILSTLKHVYWPWKLLNGSVEGSDFLKAADAANHGVHLSAGAAIESLFTAPNNIMGAEVASARAAQHRLQRGIWTTTSFGDMRRALAASERLVLLGVDKNELRDYGILLYHCRLYEPAFRYLNEYHVSQNADIAASSAMPNSQEAVALENVLLRLRLILSEQKWNIPTPRTVMGDSLTEPW